MNFFSKLKINAKWVILVCVPVASVLVAYYFISKMDKKYKSTAQIATGFTTDDAVKLNDSPSNPFDVNTNFNNIIESMNSVPVLTLVSYRLVLHDLENDQTFREFDPGMGDGSIDDEEILRSKTLFKERLEKFKTLNLFDADDQLLFRILKGFSYDHESLSERLDIHRLAASDFISIEFSSEDPFLSALTVNAVCQEFIRYNKTLKTDRSSESLEFLENMVREKKKILDEKNLALNDYKVNNNVFNNDAETKSKYALITEYELKRERQSSELNSLQLSLKSVESSIQNKKTALSKVNQQETATVNQRIIDIKKEINDLNNADPDGNRSRVNRLREELQLETSRLEAANANKADQAELKRLETERDELKLNVEIAQTNLTNVDQSIKKLRSEVSGVSSKQANTSDYEREVSLASIEYVNAQDKYTAAKNKSLVIGSSIRQILEGQPSYQPEPTQAPLWLGMIGGGSFLLTLFGILLVSYADPTIRVSSRLEKLTGLKNIGSVNLLKSKDFNMREIFNDRSTNKEYETFSHFLRKLRYEIQSSEGKVFLITSTQVKAGKTFLIISLSYALSLVSKKVLIIDTNFRHNSLTKALLPHGRGGENRKLLKKALLFEEEEDELLLEEATSTGTLPNNEDGLENTQQTTKSGIVNRTRFNGVDIIGNVGGRDSPSEIMAGRDFNEMIHNLSLQYDYVLMEGPALNDYSDSKELIGYADKVIPVFRADTSLSQMDKESINYLKSINGRLMGTVLNNVQLKNLTY
jgi:succinoglycan biosynthesis transport protein ExoP